jgi:hypothetical protein
MNITITEDTYQEVISEIGYPVIGEEDLEMTRSQIQSLYVWPAMREFFRWFPKSEVSSHSITGSFSIPFPNDTTFGIVDSRLNTSMSSGARTTSPFMNEIMIQGARGTSGVYGTRNDYGMLEARYMERATQRASNEYARAHKVTVQGTNVIGYTNVPGELILTWAKFSTSFSDIPFIRQQNVIDLAKANTLEGFAMLRGQASIDAGIEFDVGAFRDRAQTLREEVMETWKQMTKVVVIRG